MRLERIQNWMKEHEVSYRYTEEDGCGSLDFEHRGLSYHIWEFADGDVPCGVETNIFYTGRSEDIEGDYEDIILKELNAQFC